MKSTKQIKKSTEISPVRWILGGLVTITLFFQTKVADPFNSPKQWVLLVVAAWLTGYLVSFRNIIFSIKPIKTLFYVVNTFIAFILLATIFTDFHYIAIFGDTQRRNGFVSYLALSIIMVATAIFIRLFNIKRLFIVTFFVGTISAIYAFMQTTGNDFIKWNNPYNSIIGTLGNPNFAAAVMAIMAVITFSSVFNSDIKTHYRISASLLTIFLIYLIYKSNAKQGLLSFILGAGIFLIIWLYSKNKKLGISAGLSGLLIFFISVLGMLQIGPLEKYLYKPSVSLRGHYWRTAIEMFRNNPLFGVGIDRYGAYFKQFREVGYPLTYGFDITSSNAHNVYLQFFATGGIFVGLMYLVLNLFIFRRAVFGIRKLNGNNKLILAGVFSAWVAFQAQSLVSIDNIGISIWGWILGGSIIGLSVSDTESSTEDRKLFQGRQNDINLSRSLISGITTLIIIVLVSVLYRGENNTYNTMVGFNLQNETSKNAFREVNLKTINSLLIDPTYALNSAINLIEAGFINEGVLAVKNIYINDPRNLSALTKLASTYEQTNEISEAITYREKISNLDPWNAVNYLLLGIDYKKQGDLIKSKAMLSKILSFAPNTEVAGQAKAELVN